MTILSLRRGALVLHNGRVVIVDAPLENDRVITRDPSTGVSEVADIFALSPMLKRQNHAGRQLPISLINENTWERAKFVADIIEPLTKDARVKRHDAKVAASKLGVSIRTIYRRVAAFRASPHLSDLIPRHHLKGGRKKSRLPPECEQIITQLINSKYLTDQRITARDLLLLVRRACKEAGLKPPCENTVRSRINALDVALTARMREGSKIAADLTRPVHGSFEVDRPMELLEIDHTVLDATIVDEDTRQSIGRAFVTFVIDVYSRCIAGVYLSLDPPDAMAVGCCLARAVLPKETWLKSLNITQPWPVWGKPSRVLVDNAKEFQSEAFRRGLAEHQIILEFRPVKQPWYGGHIESLIKTQMQEIHKYPGTTKSNPQKRGAYKSDEHSILTFREMEACLAIAAIKYNNAIHSKLLTTPIARYQSRILGDENTVGCGYPPAITDARRFYLDFLPTERRTIQKYGIQFNGIRYNSDALQSWLHRRDVKSREFLFAYDKRNMRVIHFFDPDIGDYVEIGTWNRTRGDFSYWEIARARALARQKGQNDADEDLIFQLLDQSQSIIEEAAKKTKAARRERERVRTRRRAHNQSASVTLKPDADAAIVPHSINNSHEEKLPGGKNAFSILEPYESEEW